MNILILCFAISSLSFSKACTPSVTTVTGTHVPESFCSGDLIFEDNFDSLDENKWRHEETLSGGGNWEFQWYVDDRLNSYTTEGNLHIKPTLTSDIFGESFLTTENVKISPEKCTDSHHYGCERQGTNDHIINPIRSAKITTVNSFAFKYGTVEFRAKMSGGDWLWPALWMMPKESVYGSWPASGEIDIMELRGNRALFADGKNVGNEHAACTIHYGPTSNVKNHWPNAHHTKNRSPGYNEDFHLYKLTWSPTEINFFIDDEIVGTVEGQDGFWKKGGFEGSGLPNPWEEGGLMAPFDQEFYIMINLAVGGNGFFSDGFNNEDGPKPW